MTATPQLIMGRPPAESMTRQGSKSIVNLLTVVHACCRGHHFPWVGATADTTAGCGRGVPHRAGARPSEDVFLTTVHDEGIYRVRNWKYNAGLIPAVPQAVRAYSLRRVGGPPFHLQGTGGAFRPILEVRNRGQQSGTEIGESKKRVLTPSVLRKGGDAARVFPSLSLIAVPYFLPLLLS